MWVRNCSMLAHRNSPTSLTLPKEPASLCAAQPPYHKGTRSKRRPGDAQTLFLWCYFAKYVNHKALWQRTKLENFGKTLSVGTNHQTLQLILHGSWHIVNVHLPGDPSEHIHCLANLKHCTNKGTFKQQGHGLQIRGTKCNIAGPRSLATQYGFEMW